MADGWRCPECGLILAPSVAQHRCDPPGAGVTTTVTPYEPPSTGTCVSTATLPPGSTWAVNVTRKGTP